ncbi:2-octaprenyl-6-methoxyphenyl hydroxylase [Arsenophonus symbiont of Ornithomya chloropus]|uniref:2-octaprenyl-6-methoxyphenyl hydroxylase n=1 Tax=Arsenophonus symbiont of Ornithomya chloropus TaxID=634121 RepID=UPI0032B21149
MKAIVVGGGVVGASLALAITKFSKGNIQVSLIAAVLPNNKVYNSFHNKTLALTYGTYQKFLEIGIWSALKKYITPIIEIYISEYIHSWVLNIKSKDYSLPAFGYVVSLTDIENYLFEELRKAPGIKLYCPDEVVTFKRKADFVLVKLRSGKILKGQLLLGADGSDSLIRKISQIEFKKKSYQQCAVIANIFTSELLHGRAFERFTQNGSLAILPLSQNKSSLIWCHPLEEKKNIMKWCDNKFIVELQKFFGWQLGEIQLVTERSFFSLWFSQAKKNISHRIVLVGNAAQTIHPVAAQGFNLGMRDIMILAKMISRVADSGGDIGNYSVLMNYQIQRDYDRQRIIKLTDNLIFLFANNNRFFSMSRGIVFMLMQKLPFVRDVFIKKIFGTKSFYY